MSEFITAFNFGNAAFGVSCAETFLLSRTGNIGTYTAISIDDLDASSSVNPGGLRGENNVIMYVTRTVIAESGMVEGSILTVRGKRVRVKSITDEEDDTIVVTCGTAGVKL